jgi:hypothetical protein
MSSVAVSMVGALMLEEETPLAASLQQVLE